MKHKKIFTDSSLYKQFGSLEICFCEAFQLCVHKLVETAQTAYDLITKSTPAITIHSLYILIHFLKLKNVYLFIFLKFWPYVQTVSQCLF